MQIKGSYHFVLPFKLFILVGLIFISGEVEAEYYLVYPVAPEVVYVSSHSRHHYRKISGYRHHHVRKRSHCNMAIYYVWPSVPACGCGSCVRVSAPCCSDWQPMYPQYYSDVYYDESSTTRYRYFDRSGQEVSVYDPDLATGDDDPIVYPGMQINY